MPKTLPKVLTTAQLAEYLRDGGVEITDEGVRRWCRKGQVPAIRLPGGQWRIRAEHARAILNPPSANT